MNENGNDYTHLAHSGRAAVIHPPARQMLKAMYRTEVVSVKDETKWGWETTEASMLTLKSAEFYDTEGEAEEAACQCIHAYLIQ